MKSNTVRLPLGGLLIAVFAVWLLPKSILQKQLNISGGVSLVLWRLVAGIIAPLCVLAVFVYTLMPVFQGSVWPFIQGLLG